MLVNSTGTRAARRRLASSSAVALAGVDHRDVDPGLLRDAGAAEHLRLVTQAAHDDLEEGPDVVVGLTDQNTSHRLHDRSTAQGFGAGMV